MIKIYTKNFIQKFILVQMRRSIVIIWHIVNFNLFDNVILDINTM